jgi:hypothetical protein
LEETNFAGGIMATDIKKRAASGIAVIVIALGAGQLVQSMSHRTVQPAPAADQTTNAEIAVQPTDIERVAASDLTTPTNHAATLAAPIQPEPQLPKAVAAEAPPAMPAEVIATDPCPVTLDLSNGENAMIGITLVSPCHVNERVVLKHAGLTITAKTTVTGALFTDLPALLQDATVEVMFSDNTSTSAQISVPELADLQRFAVQWQADDAFHIHAFEGPADFDGPGDISNANPQTPVAGVPPKGGFITALGDAATELPMLAEVYTFAADARVKPEIAVEAPVTATACGREILGQTLQTNTGVVDISDISLTMPQCDAIGDYLVLKNLASDTNIASN